MITKEQLEARKAQLQKQHEELRANLQAVAGAIQMCDLLLAEIENSVSSAPSCKNSDD